MSDMGSEKKVFHRMGVIDVGSNSVRFVVFEGENRSPAYFYNEKVLCGLGLDLPRTGVLHPTGKARALLALKRFIKIAARMDLTSLRAVATEAVRAADDGEDFCEQVRSEIDLDLEIISGIEEAQLSAKGVLLGRPTARGLMCDIGGSSMELADIKDGKVSLAQTSKLGPMAVMGLYDDPQELNAHINRTVDALVSEFKLKPDVLYLVGGSWRAIAHLHMLRTDYPLRVLHDYSIEGDALAPTLDMVEASDLEALNEFKVASERRLILLPTAATILRALLTRLQPKTISFSSYGLREGMLYDNMNADVRALDPLIEAARADENAQARFPGFGEILFDWLIDLFAQIDHETRRLIHAACLLHDVHWRSHPDYRSDVCFDAATHANLGGIDHRGRIFLAWILMHRYKVKRVSAIYTEVQELISPEDLTLAQTVGHAIRLGAMLSGADSALMGKLRIDDTTVYLDLPTQSKEILGEVVLKRLQKLGAEMQRETVVNYV